MSLLLRDRNYGSRRGNGFSTVSAAVVLFRVVSVANESCMRVGDGVPSVFPRFPSARGVRPDAKNTGNSDGETLSRQAKPTAAERSAQSRASLPAHRIDIAPARNPISPSAEEDCSCNSADLWS